MNRKAFEVQFNWLFVLVAGAAILLFFTVVVVKQKSVAETSTKATVLKNVEAIITSAGVSMDTTNIISIPNSNIEVECNRISLGIVSKQFQNLVLFAPSLIKGDKLVTQTLAFNAPYRATNLLYVTSPQMRYVIIGDNDVAREINKTLPSEINKEFYQSNPAIKNENNYKVKFVIVGNMIELPNALESMPDADVTAIKVSGDIEKGTIEFWQKDGNSWQAKGSSAYIGKASLIGAVYTDNLEMYNCNMQAVFSRLNLVTKIYIDGVRKVMQKTGPRQNCNQFYNNALTQLNKILTASVNFDKANVDTILEASNSLANENKNMQVYSCTLVY